MTVGKEEIYELLQEANVAVYQQRPEVLATFPCLIFSMVSNSVTMSLSKSIGRQDIEFSVDIYTRGVGASTEASTLLSTVEGILREGGYQMVYSADVPDPSDDVIHISTRFNLVA